MPVSDDVMRTFLNNTGVWEAELGTLIRGLAQQAKHFIDIGANVGYFSRMVAQLNSNCHIESFEPHPLTYSVLELNTWEFGDQVRCWPLALGDSLGTIGMLTEPNNLGDTHIQEGGILDIVVPVASLDAVCPDLVVDFAKIDVQGSELACIRGMLGVIARSPNIKLLVEFWPTRLYQLGQEPLTILNAYRSLGLQLHLQKGNSLIAASEQEILEYCAVSGPHAQANLLLSKV